MSEAECLFVYGTLLPTEPQWGLLAPFASSPREAWAAGVLYDTGRGYPAARFGEDGRIQGVVVDMAPELVDQAWVALDRYEGTVTGDYRRIRIEVTTTDGRLPAWGYDHRGDPAGLVPVPGGDWRLRRA